MADASEVARAHDEAWNTKDVEGRKAWSASDIETELPGGMQLKGLDQVRQVEEAFWEALPDSQIKYTNEFTAGDAVITEGFLTGTHTGVFRTPQGEIPPSGNPVNLRFAAIKRISGDKVISEHLYFDQMEFMMQIGALPPMGSA
jgi:predicted ester cyclase